MSVLGRWPRSLGNEKLKVLTFFSGIYQALDVRGPGETARVAKRNLEQFKEYHPVARSGQEADKERKSELGVLHVIISSNVPDILYTYIAVLQD